MSSKPIEIDPEVIRVGVKKAAARSRDALLCIVGTASIRFIGSSDPRLIVSWEHAIEGPGSPQAYVVPSLVLQLLASPASQELASITMRTEGKYVVMGMMDRRSRCEMRWSADIRQFPAPPQLAEMLAVPRGMLSLNFISFSDAAHQAVANLVNLHSVKHTPAEKLAILMDFSSSRLALDGRTIVNGIQGSYYFDPRLLIRALEFIKSRILQVGITPLRSSQRAVLTLLAEEDGWQVQCGLLSIGLDTGRLYPPPSERQAGAKA